MVIFILLLLVFLNNRAAVNETLTDALLKDLQKNLGEGQFHQEDIHRDGKDRDTIVVQIPDQLMTFKANEYELKPEGETFLQSHVAVLAKILCADPYRDSLEGVIVEGHSDSSPYRGASMEESQQRNLKLSQDRSMEVVKKTLLYLQDSPNERACLLEKLSATGRGEQDLEATADKSRRVVFKIRVNSSRGLKLADELLRTFH
jgi:flagellar motor protein MotB